MILKFPDFPLTFEDFLISLTILHSSLTFPDIEEKTNFPDFSLTSGHPVSNGSHTCNCKKGSDWLKRWVEAQRNIFKL